MRVLVTGTTGFIGWHCVNTLLADNHEVIALLRPDSDASLAHEQAAMVRADVHSDEELDKAISTSNPQAIVHCAGIVRAASEDKYHRANYTATRNLCASAKKHGVKRFIHISSLAAGGMATLEKGRDENQSDAPLTNYGFSKFEGEFPVRHLMSEFTILRPCSVFGPREKDFLTSFKMIAEKGMDLRTSKEPPLLSLIDGRDVARAVSLSLSNEKTINKTYYLSDGKIWKWDDFVNILGEYYGKNVRVRKLPMWLVDIYGIFLHAYSTLTGKTMLINAEKLFEMSQDAWTCSNALFVEDTGFTPQLGLREAIYETAAWYEEKGWIKPKR